MIQSQSYSFSCIVVTFFLFLLNTLSSPTFQYCRHDQRDVLLEIKQEFSTNESTQGDNFINSWNKSYTDWSYTDCCFWAGVQCDYDSGKVIGLYFENIPLNKSLKPNSGLFKLQYLEYLSFSNSSLYGEIPSSLQNLSHLVSLDLSSNELSGQIPTSVGSLTNLIDLMLNNNNLAGKIPFSFANLTNLSYLHLNDNDFESELPHEMSKLIYLNYVDGSANSFSGAFPSSLLTSPSLAFIYLGKNQFKGSIDFGNIYRFPSLAELDLSYNNFTGPIPRSISKLLNLYSLDLSNNKLEGHVPSCLLRLTRLKLSHNSFSSFERPKEVVTGLEMRLLDLDSNIFQGLLPHLICKFVSIEFLDLSNNNFSGPVPSCLRSCTNFVQVINLRNNSFSGTLPDMFFNGTKLKTLDVSRNRLQGKLPKSLISCKAMELLNVESNKFKDKFPSWLSSLPSLNVLILRSNQLYGPLHHHHHHHQDVSNGFQSLKVIDVSHNDFTGALPALYFSSWTEMITSNAEYGHDIYMEDPVNLTGGYRNSMEMVHKGVDTEFQVIRKDFIAIDFSGNKFCGKIPESIGLLKGLRLLNLSSNGFTSDIPQSLANLINLEALDLSRNRLVGQIPQSLGMLSFLSTMNFSHNNLEGPIPRSTQFQLQNCSSFVDNPRLYGLDGICEENSIVPNPAPTESGELSEPEEEHVISWIAAAIAYGPGVFCGLVIGHIFVSQKHEWLMEKFRRVIRSTR